MYLSTNLTRINERENKWTYQQLYSCWVNNTINVLVIFAWFCLLPINNYPFTWAIERTNSWFWLVVFLFCVVFFLFFCFIILSIFFFGFQLMCVHVHEKHVLKTHSFQLKIELFSVDVSSLLRFFIIIIIFIAFLW